MHPMPALGLGTPLAVPPAKVRRHLVGRSKLGINAMGRTLALLAALWAVATLWYNDQISNEQFMMALPFLFVVGLFFSQASR